MPKYPRFDGSIDASVGLPPTMTLANDECRAQLSLTPYPNGLRYSHVTLIASAGAYIEPFTVPEPGDPELMVGFIAGNNNAVTLAMRSYPNRMYRKKELAVATLGCGGLTYTPVMPAVTIARHMPHRDPQRSAMHHFEGVLKLATLGDEGRSLPRYFYIRSEVSKSGRQPEEVLKLNARRFKVATTITEMLIPQIIGMR